MEDVDGAGEVVGTLGADPDLRVAGLGDGATEEGPRTTIEGVELGLQLPLSVLQVVGVDLSGRLVRKGGLDHGPVTVDPDALSELGPGAVGEAEGVDGTVALHLVAGTHDGVVAVESQPLAEPASLGKAGSAEPGRLAPGATLPLEDVDAAPAGDEGPVPVHRHGGSEPVPGLTVGGHELVDPGPGAVPLFEDQHGPRSQDPTRLRGEDLVAGHGDGGTELGPEIAGREDERQGGDRQDQTSELLHPQPLGNAHWGAGRDLRRVRGDSATSLIQ